MRLPLLILALLALAAGASAAVTNPVSPPPNAQLVGFPARIEFRWPKQAGLSRLEIFASGRTVHSEVVQGNSEAVTLQPGPMYQWRVLSLRGDAPSEVVPLRTFSLSADLEFHCDGTPGALGGPGDEVGRSGSNGGPGGRGGDGERVSLRLDPEGDFVLVSISASKLNRSFLLVPSSSPILVTTVGGEGGTGGDGDNGLLVQNWSNPYNPPYPYPPQGSIYYSGGDGGNGGVITIQAAPGVAPSRHLVLRVQGGRGGRSGSPGRGGQGSTWGASGQSGAPGPEGRSGLDGMVNGL